MSKIFELFGHRLDSWNTEAKHNLSEAWCPYMGAECDGGGNRYLSALDLSKITALQKYFPSKQLVQAGVCSLQLQEGQQPWIVCPRRLLSLKPNAGPDYQSHVRNKLLHHAALPKGQKFRAWAEVKMKVGTLTEDEQEKSFDYSFDYILAGQTRMRVEQAATMLKLSPKKVISTAEKSGFTLARRDGGFWIEDFPSDPIVIVEIMTSSTSGGDKKKRTQIGMAFEDAVLDGLNHKGPGINYRQVWARMVSQLIVKSQVGLAWGGKTFWLLQDVLADYISSSTALNLEDYIKEAAEEVNILSFGYGNLNQSKGQSIHEIKDSKFYAGPISRGAAATSGFVDIVKIGAPPPKEHLWRSLFTKPPVGTLIHS